MRKALQRWIADEVTNKPNNVPAGFDLAPFRLVSTTHDYPRQENGSDCGVFSSMCADFLSEDLPLTFSQRDMPHFRHRIAIAILTACLDGHGDNGAVPYYDGCDDNDDNDGDCDDDDDDNDDDNNSPSHIEAPTYNARALMRGAEHLRALRSGDGCIMPIMPRSEQGRSVPEHRMSDNDDDAPDNERSRHHKRTRRIGRIGRH